MKHITPLFTFAFTFAFIFAFSSKAETYTLVGQRHLRKYVASVASPAYNAETDAATAARELCTFPWVRSTVKNATLVSHTEEKNADGVPGLDANVGARENFDAALWCSYHVGGQHRAYANAAVYVYALPEGTLPKLTRLEATVTSDPYNAPGARIVLVTNSTGEIPTACATCRGDVEGGIKLAGVAPRTTRQVDGSDYWYPTTTNAVFDASVLPAGGLQLQRYLFVFVLMENYSTVRGNWLEGCSMMRNDIRITTDVAMPGWTDTGTVDLSEVVTQSTTLHLVNLMTGGTDTTFTVSGPVHSMVQIAPDASNHLAIITGDFSEHSISGTPGLVVWNFDTRSVVTIREDTTHPIPASIKSAMRQRDVGLRYNTLRCVNLVLGFVPASRNSDNCFSFDPDNGGLKVTFEGDADYDISRSSVQDVIFAQHYGKPLEMYRDRITDDSSSPTNRSVESHQIELSGDITNIDGAAFGSGSLIVAGDNTIKGNSCAVKLLYGGEVLDFNIDPRPDTFSSFKARQVLPLSSADIFGYQLTGLGENGAYAIPRINAMQKGCDFGSYLIGENVYDDGRTLAHIPHYKIGIPSSALLLTGEFDSIAGLPAKGMALLSLIARADGDKSARIKLTPFNIGKVRNACIFGSEESQLDSKVSHLLVEFAD